MTLHHLGSVFGNHLMLAFFIILSFFWTKGKFKLLKRNSFNLLVIQFACIIIKSKPLGVRQQLFILRVTLIETYVN